MTDIRRKLILIADDFDHAAELLADLVEHETSYEAVSAKDGRAALARAQERRPDAAVLDVDMPHIGGIDAARLLRAAFGERRPLLIAVTGGTNTEGAELSGLFDFVFHKPLDAERLIKVLETNLAG